MFLSHGRATLPPESWRSGGVHHIHTDRTPPGTLAGAWWETGSPIPRCTWVYIVNDRLMHVSEGQLRISRVLPVGAAGRHHLQRRRRLPALAIALVEGVKKRRSA